MIFSQFIARRYLFSKKTTNAINLITGISIAGITVGMAALILELAVFNGFESLLAGLFNKFNPDIKITATSGKFFESDSLIKTKLLNIEGVLHVSEVLEEVALFDHEDNIAFASIKGVDANYLNVNNIKSTIISGEFDPGHKGDPGAIIGVNLKNRLGISIQNPLSNLKIFVPRTKRRTILDQPFKSAYLRPTGAFAFQHEHDNQYIFSDLSFVENLLNKQGQRSAYEVSVDNGASIAKIKSDMSEMLGSEYLIQNRMEQDAAFFRLMNLEKWMFYALFCLTLVLIAFNMIGALWMIVLDKKKDISVLKALGADSNTIYRIFMNEGLLISGIGVIVGSVLALALYWYHTQYGLIAIPDGFIVDRYPMKLIWTDFVIASITMLCIGLLASWMPARKARKISAILRVE
jgi:lipoprotein-releasing system permease protein